MEQNEAFESNLVTMQGDKGMASDATHDLVAATSFRVHGRKRMARQRRSSSACNKVLSLASSTSHVPSTLLAREIDPAQLSFLFEKELKSSDVGSLRRMVLPKKAAETHLPVLESKEGMIMRIDDMDGLHSWSFRFRFWPNNNSRMYVLENTGDFVNAHGLQLGDSVVLFQDNQSQNYVIQARKACHQPAYAEYSDNVKVDDGIVLRGYEINKCSYFHANFPNGDHAGTSFIYETTCSTDSTFDFSGGSMTRSYSRVDPLESFESVETLCLDDFC